MSTSLNEVSELYALFPERLKQTVADKRKETFSNLWHQLTPTEKIEINEARSPAGLQRKITYVEPGSSSRTTASPSLTRRVLPIDINSPRIVQLSVCPPNEQSEIQQYETKLEQLHSDYEQRREARVKETIGLDQSASELSLIAFDKAYNSLIQITRDQLLAARSYHLNDSNENQPRGTIAALV